MPEEFESALVSRYASKEMLAIFSRTHRYTIWRKLWIALARAQKNLGLPIRGEQILAMEKKLHDIDFRRAAYYEKQLGHDVMAHLHAFVDVCPEAKGVLHLGATSCYITDNTDLLLMKEGLEIIKAKLLDTIRKLSIQANTYAHLPCLSYTHLQVAQPTTIGKRICMWIQDLLMDFQDLIDVMQQLHFLGAKGACGTQAAFLSLFEGSVDKVWKMEKLISEEMGFPKLLRITGQSYTRKQDVRIVNTLSSFAVSAHKFAVDMRLLSHLKEVEEPFGEKHVSIITTPYKRNPNRSERLCGLACFLMNLAANPMQTASAQWLERSLDDSANRRLTLPDAFLCADAILNLYHYIASGLIVYPKIVEANLAAELPFLGSDAIVKAAVDKGQDKQKVQEALRKIIQETSIKWKEQGIKEDLFAKIASSSTIDLSSDELRETLTPSRFIGRSSEIVHHFLANEVHPLLQRYEQIQTYRLDIEI